jgi:sarcosine oxidase
MRYDAIILGIGGMGSATAYHLARRGCKVLGIEQFGIPHEFGSSHGVTRIIRLAYAEHPAYVPLLRRAYALWRELETDAREQLLWITGGFDIGDPECELVRGSLRACREHHLAFELLDARAIAQRHPGYCLPANMVGVYQAEGGYVAPERAILSQVALAEAAGAEIHTRERVLGWSAEAGGVSVRTEHATYAANRLVITAGPWAAQCVPQLRPLAVPERQVLIWTEPREPALFAPEVFPIFNMEAPEGRYYGFPVHGVPGFKFGKYHHLHENVNPDAMDRECHAQDEALLREGVRRYFPAADGPTLAMQTCLFTNSPDEHFVLDLHPEFPQVSIAAGFSGHGFKFAPVIGEIMADFALEGGCAKWDLSLFRLARFPHAL